MTWTRERVEALKVLWGEGNTASQIAYRLGEVSRSAVIGKVHRLGLSGRAVTVRPRKSPAKLSIFHDPSTGQKRKRAPKFSTEPLPALDPVPERTISLPDLEDHHCRWIYGDVGSSNWGFCGQEREVGSYCQRHSQRCYTGSYVPSRAIQNADVNWKIARAKKETVE